MAQKKEDNMSYDEFINYAVETLIDGVITGGFGELRTRFKHRVMNVLFNIQSNGGFRDQDKAWGEKK